MQKRSEKLWAQSRAKLWQSLIWLTLAITNGGFAFAAYKSKDAASLIGCIIALLTFIGLLIHAAKETGRLINLAMNEEGHENQTPKRHVSTL